MIGLIVGTSEGKKIVSMLNGFTEDLFISTATKYGGELLENYKYKVLNSSPLNLQQIIEVIKLNNINIFIDASHPYALEVTKNVVKACDVCKIPYIRYERPSVVEKYESYEKLMQVDTYEEIYDCLKNVRGNVLNTSGSRNMDKILRLGLENRIIHRVLPSLKVMEECFNLGVKVDDLIAIKGPISYDLNLNFIKEYNAKAIIMKDSGVEGGTGEKLEAAICAGIYAIVIKRSNKKLDKVFSSIEEMIVYIRNIQINNKSV
ncbi:cobalt-precorrin-6A reductase [Clostridium sp. KNHs214]|uniref:cobalt-precorrin-6A reductase n=1 Tax=Clostridium sp. KNHs214 TaxID=1540257 RepID=UPI000553D6A7|nr:cobalt-precorrin-6A reductase [Clostridium sp. KNHs214]